MYNKTKLTSCLKVFVYIPLFVWHLKTMHIIKITTNASKTNNPPPDTLPTAIATACGLSVSEVGVYVGTAVFVVESAAALLDNKST